MADKSGRLSLDTKLFVNLQDLLKPDFILVDNDNTIRSVCNILCQKNGNNVRLKGPKGVGKSAIVMGIAAQQKAMAEDGAKGVISLDIIGKTFVKLDVPTLLALDDIEGFKSELRNIALSGDQVIVIDNFGGFIDGIKTHPEGTKIFNALLAVISREDTQSIIIHDDNEERKVLEALSDQDNMFTCVEVPVPSKDQALTILRGLRRSYEAKHGIVITDEALKIAVELPEKYKSLVSGQGVQPRISIRLIDQAASEFRAALRSRPEKLDDLESAFGRLTNEMESIGESKKPKDIQRKAAIELELAEVRPEMEQLADNWQQRTQALTEKLREKEGHVRDLRDVDDAIAQLQLANRADGEAPLAAQQKLKREVIKALAEDNREISALDLSGGETPCLTDEHTKHTFSLAYNLSLDKMNEDELEKVLNFEKNAGKRIYGQDHALEAIGGAIRLSKTELKEEGKPIAAFIFIGPSGVGKTETCIVVADIMGLDLIDLDMSEYAEKHDVARLVGAPPGYSGYDPEGGQMYKRYRKSPDAFWLFDEIEKAHPDITDPLLQVTDKARLTDGAGCVSDFQNSIVALTTNIGGKHFLPESGLTFEQACEKAKEDLYTRFRPEFLGRCELVFYKPLTDDLIFQITKKLFHKIEDIMKRSDIDVHADDADIVRMIAQENDSRSGARSIKKFITETVKRKLATFLLQQRATVSADGSQSVTVTYEIGKGIQFKYANGPSVPVQEPAMVAAPADNLG